MKDIILIIVIYLCIINLIAFVCFGIDKRRAKRGEWRIAEKHLILTAVLGGSVGAMIGMRVFHHKTKHMKFTVGIPLIFTMQILLVWYLLMRLS